MYAIVPHIVNAYDMFVPILNITNGKKCRPTRFSFPSPSNINFNMACSFFLGRFFCLIACALIWDLHTNNTKIIQNMYQQREMPSSSSSTNPALSSLTISIIIIIMTMMIIIILSCVPLMNIIYVLNSIFDEWLNTATHCSFLLFPLSFFLLSLHIYSMSASVDSIFDRWLWLHRTSMWEVLWIYDIMIWNMSCTMLNSAYELWMKI